MCFARTGGEANAIAIRLARLQAGKRTKVLACGYHGWHDWYLASKNKETKKIQKINFHCTLIKEFQMS